MLDRRLFLLSSAALCIGAGACGARNAPAAAANKARADLYNCEGCEGVFERPSADLPASIVMAQGEKGTPLIVEGRVLNSDGVTPAAGVILYIYHTNADGLYANGSNETEWSRRHGRIRGWLKTGADGHYRIRTIKPAPYPGEQFPAHLHFTVLEPGKRPYYIDDVVFDGEFGVTDTYRARQELRAGSGISQLAEGTNGIPVATRDIILERHP